MSKSCLVIGGSGFLGGHLVSKLISKNFKVKATFNSNPKGKISRHPSVEFFKADICQGDQISELLRGIDYVFVCANISSIYLSLDNYKKQINQINTEGIKNVVQGMIKNKTEKLVYLSSVAAMGTKVGIEYYDENTLCEPEDVYGNSKLAAENYLQSICKEGLINAAILRPPGIYGPGGLGPLHKIVSFLHKGLVPIIGDGENLQSIAYVGNVVNAAISLAEMKTPPGATYLISDAKPYTVNELVLTTARAMGKKCRIVRVPVSFLRFSGEILDWLSRITGRQMPISRKSIEAIVTDRVFKVDKIRNELGFKFEFELETGLKHILN